MNDVKITYRGWPGHFICAYRCVFHLNTLVECGETRIVVSTVGQMLKHDGEKDKLKTEAKYDQIGYNRYYETMVFHAEEAKTGWGTFWDADVARELDFFRAVEMVEDELLAQQDHEEVVAEIADKLRAGEMF